MKSIKKFYFGNTTFDITVGLVFGFAYCACKNSLGDDKYYYVHTIALPFICIDW